MNDPKLRPLQVFFQVFGWLSLILFTVLLAAFTFELPATDIPMVFLPAIAWLVLRPASMKTRAA